MMQLQVFVPNCSKSLIPPNLPQTPTVSQHQNNFGKKSHRSRNIVLSLVVWFIIVVIASYAYFSTANNSVIASSISSSNAASALSSSNSISPPISKSSSLSISSRSIATSNGPLQIAVTDVVKSTISSPAGQSGYIYYIQITDTDSQSHFVNPFNFQLISNSNTVYSPGIVIGSDNLLNSLTLSPGQHTTGQVAFNVVNGDTPGKLEYKYELESIDEFVTGLPQPSGYVSEVDGLIVNMPATLIGLIPTTEINSSIYATPGQILSFVIQFSTVLCNLGTLAIGSMDITTAGFSILSFSAKTVGSQDGVTSYPISICGNGQEMIPVTVNIALPPSGYFQGILYLNFQLTSTPYSFGQPTATTRNTESSDSITPITSTNHSASFITAGGCYNVTTTYVTSITHSSYTSTYSATSIVVTGTPGTVTGTTFTFSGGTYDCKVYGPTTFSYAGTTYTITGTTFVENYTYTVSQTDFTTTETITSTYTTSAP